MLGILCNKDIKRNAEITMSIIKFLILSVAIYARENVIIELNSYRV